MAFRCRSSYKMYLQNTDVGIPRETKRRRQQEAETVGLHISADYDDNDVSPVSGEAASNDMEDEQDSHDFFSEEPGNEDVTHEDDEIFIAGGDKAIFHGSSLTRGQLFTLVFAFILRHSCTEVAVSDLIALFNTVIPGCLPGTKYFFRKSLNRSMSENVETHAYCSICGSYLSKVDSSCGSVRCLECDADVKCTDMVKNGCSFLFYPLKKQLKNLMEKTNVMDICRNMCDIADGLEYKKLNICIPNTISLTCNTDGVPLFSSSNSSLWPVYFVVNELPVRMKMVYMMLVALWHGQCKPKMETLFASIVEELQTLHDEGFQWMKNGKIVTTKVTLCIFCCDSVARPCLQNVKQFNGKFGCGFCEHPGTVISKGQGTVRVYLESTSKPKERTHSSMIEHGKLASANNQCVFGVKGPSILSMVPQFDIAQGFVPDYMHSVLLGVVRQFVFLWFDSQSHAEPYYLGRHTGEIDKMLLNMKPPSEIKRLPRSVTMRKYWKASEFRNFLLFYSAVCLKQFLPKAFLHHWYLLIFAVNRLMSSRIQTSAIEICDIALHKFVVLVQELYGDEHVSYNVHLLTHLASSVERWGPLWANSAFMFEDANGKLLTFLHGSRGVEKQIFRSFIGISFVRQLTSRYIDSYCVTLLDKLSNVAVLCQNCLRISDGIVALGHPIRTQLTAAENVAVSNCVNPAHLCSHEMVSYPRCIIRNKVLHTERYSRSVRSCDCCFGVSNRQGTYVLQSCGIVNICHGTNCGVHCIEQTFVLFAYCMDSLMPFHVHDVDVGSNLLSHFRKGVIDRKQLVAFCGDTFACKLFMCSGPSSNAVVVIEVPPFELD